MEKYVDSMGRTAYLGENLGSKRDGSFFIHQYEKKLQPNGEKVGIAYLVSSDYFQVKVPAADTEEAAMCEMMNRLSIEISKHEMLVKDFKELKNELEEILR